MKTFRTMLVVVFASVFAVTAGCDDDGGAAPADSDANTVDTGTVADKDTDQGKDVTAKDGGAKKDAAAANDSGSVDTASVDTSHNTPTDADGPSGAFNFFQTCGDPVCSGWKSKPNVPLCTSETVGAACTSKGGTCDPKNNCNALLLCTDKDPKAGPGGCPISQRAAKREISYLNNNTERAYAEQLYGMKLATWRYKAGDGSKKLGIIIEDAPRSIAVDGRGDRIDLYSYTSLAIAAVKQQRRLIEQQGAELRKLRKAVKELSRRVKRQ